MKFKSIFWIAVLLQMGMVACQGQTVPTPIPPAPPTQFLDLPVNARIVCPEEDNLRRGSIALWPDIARPPLDDSSTNPDMGGDQTGIVDHCTAVTVLDYEWSEFEQDFWLLIDVPNHNQGWLSAKYVDLTH